MKRYGGFGDDGGDGGNGREMEVVCVCVFFSMCMRGYICSCVICVYVFSCVVVVSINIFAHSYTTHHTLLLHITHHTRAPPPRKPRYTNVH